MSGDGILNLPVLWMAVVVLGAIYALTAGIYLLVTALAVQERARAFKAISPGMLFATSVGVAVVLIASHSRPFSGQLAVSPAVLLQVMPEAGVPGP
jgi:hypothetical protein